MSRALALAAAALTLSGCALPPSSNTTSNPERYTTKVDVAYRVAQQAELVDCLVDGMGSITHNPLVTHVAQYRRAAGWRVAVLAANDHYVVADVTDAGRLTVKLGDYPGVGVNGFRTEVAAGAACAARFAAPK